MEAFHSKLHSSDYNAVGRRMFEAHSEIDTKYTA